MSINFRFSYNGGLNFNNLFPKTNMSSIIDTTNLLQYTTMTVTIPPTSSSELNQTINIQTTSSQVNAPVDMYLVSSGVQAQSDYNTITQFSVTSNQLNITRLYAQPSGSINVRLVFKEGT